MRVDTASLLIVGSYHMANPGRDVFNVQAEDVLADRRQRELREVVDHLKRFAPTKVALELATDYERNLKIFANLARSTVPGIAFSRNNRRLRLGVCYRIQLRDTIPIDGPDILLDAVITD